MKKSKEAAKAVKAQRDVATEYTETQFFYNRRNDMLK